MFEARFLERTRTIERSFTVEEEIGIFNRSGQTSQTGQQQRPRPMYTVSEPKYRIEPLISRSKMNVRQGTIVSKPGRISYVIGEHKIAYKDHKETPSGYVSIQSKINTGPDGTVNIKELVKYLEKSKFHKIDHTKKEHLLSMDPGCRVAYITKENKWRSGGFFICLNKSNNPNSSRRTKSSTGIDFILYKAFSNGVYSLQIEDIASLYVTIKGKKKATHSTKKEKESRRRNCAVFNPLGPKTNFPVLLKDFYGNDVVVYYARSEYARKRFMDTDKFNTAREKGNWVVESDYDNESDTSESSDTSDSNSDSDESSITSDDSSGSDDS